MIWTPSPPACPTEVSPSDLTSPLSIPLTGRCSFFHHYGSTQSNNLKMRGRRRFYPPHHCHMSLKGKGAPSIGKEATGSESQVGSDILEKVFPGQVPQRAIIHPTVSKRKHTCAHRGPAKGSRVTQKRLLVLFCASPGNTFLFSSLFLLHTNPGTYRYINCRLWCA